MKELNDNELRVGNLVLDSTKNTTKVESIIPEHGRIRYGIPLSEEWLLRLGFVKNEYSVDGVQYREPFFHVALEAKGWLVNWNEDFGWVIHLMQSSYNMIPVNTVHRLQNLFYLLTGEELTIK